MDAHAGLQRNQDEQGRAQRHQHVRAQSRRSAYRFAFVTQQSAQQHGQRHAHQDAGEVADAAQVREFIGDGAPDLVPLFSLYANQTSGTGLAPDTSTYALPSKR
jgi:hypothetical protein